MSSFLKPSLHFVLDYILNYWAYTLCSPYKHSTESQEISLFFLKILNFNGSLKSNLVKIQKDKYENTHTHTHTHTTVFMFLSVHVM